MTSPRLEIDLAVITANAKVLTSQLHRHGISVTGVTKATLGSPEIARAMIAGGVTQLADSRVENLMALKESGIRVPLTLLRSPTPKQVPAALACATTLVITDPDVVMAIDQAAGMRGPVANVILMAEFGDLREGLMPDDLIAIATRIRRLAHVRLAGIAINLACFSGVIPNHAVMDKFLHLVNDVERIMRYPLRTISGGNSASLTWAQTEPTPHRVNDLRLGESLLLGVDPLTRQPIAGLGTDAFTLVATVIESAMKPTHSWGSTAQGSFGITAHDSTHTQSTSVRTVVNVGVQDIDPADITAPQGMRIMGASSDHLVLETPHRLTAGTEIRFGVGYGSLLRSMTSPFVAERLRLPYTAPSRLEGAGSRQAAIGQSG